MKLPPTFNDEARRQRGPDGAGPFAEMAEFAPVGMCAVDAAGQVLYANLRWSQILAVKEPQRGLGTDWMAAVDAADLPAVQACWDEAVRHGRAGAAEFQTRGASGVAHWMRLRIEPTDRLASTAAFVAVVMDITDERQATARLRASEQRLELALHATGLGLWEYVPQDDLAYLSERWSRILGFPSEARYLKSVDLVDMAIGDSALAFRDALVDLLKGGIGRFCIEHEARTATGGRVWLQTEAQVTERDAQGRATRVVGTTKDITQRRHELQSLQDALNAAESASRAKADFLATMSHEIRTPINGVIGLARMLEDADLAPKEAGYVRMVNSCANTLLGLVNDVLDFSKIEAGQMVLSEVPTQLHVLVKEACDVVQERARAKNIRFGAQVEPDVAPWISADPQRLRQILLNLLGNALKFTSEGGFSLRVSRAPAEGREVLRFAVSDTGIGIAPADQDKLFRRFSQVDASSTRRFQGTGLGLAISHDLAVMMGGSLRVASALGAGATFTLELPLREATPDSKPAPAAAGSASDAAILLVEDNAINRLVARALLAKLGYGNVRCAEDGAQAVALCREQPFDLVLMDCQMPVMDGFEATRQIRRAGFDRPIIALTAGAVVEDRAHCLQAGMNDYLAKPVDAVQLGACVNLWLGLGEVAKLAQA